MANEITILIKAKTDVRSGVDGARNDAQRTADDIGNAFTQRLTERLHDGNTKLMKLGGDNGDSFGRSFGDRFRGVVDRFIPNAVSGALGNAFAGLSGGDLKTAGLVGLTAALSPLIGSAISAAVPLALGGGVLAGGIALAAQNGEVQNAFKGLKDQLFDRNLKEIDDKIKAAKDRFAKAKALGSEKGMASAQYDINKAEGELSRAADFNAANRSLKDMASVFEGPLIRAAKKFADTVKELKPDIQDLFDTMAPVVDVLVDGFTGFVKTIMPGIKDAVKASVPLFEALGEYLPVIGDAIGDFFSKISANSEDTSQFFADLLDAVVMLIDFLGSVIVVLAKMYSAGRKAILGLSDFFGDLGHTISNVWNRAKRNADASFRDMHNAVAGFLSRARSAFSSIVSAIGNAMTSAYNRVVGFVNRAISIIRSIPGRIGNLAVNVVPRVIGGAVSAVRSALGFAHGGIVGAASGMVAGGLTMVGENGPELVNLPTGSTVKSNPDSRRMLREMSGSQGGGTMDLRLTGVAPGVEQTLTATLLAVLRTAIQQQGGNVQTVLGRGY